MRAADFDYELPRELIAQRPLADRAASRLLVVDGTRDALSDRRFRELPDLLEPGDLLVFNDTRVIPARLHGYKAGSGGRVEVLVERIGDDGRTADCHIRASKAPGPGMALVLAEGALEAHVVERCGALFRLDFGAAAVPLLETLEAYGEVPLPPYIERAPETADQVDYQTVYARKPGAVAAPTAGLHFDEALLQRLRAAGIAMTTITLHVGAGTFQPVRAEQVEDHTMHSEWARVPQAAAQAIAAAQAAGRRVIAVGTTVVRTLEAAADDQGTVDTWQGETDLFLRPGSRFRVIDGMVTNFHLPQSTLLMLVCAFAGQQRVLRAYRHAVAERYRFFSYGDAMLAWPDPAVRG